MRKGTVILFALVLLLVAGSLAVRQFLKRKGAAVVLGALGGMIDKGPKESVVTRVASGEGALVEEAFIANHKALMAGDWEAFKKSTRAENARQIESAGGEKMIPLIRGMTPAHIAIKAIRVEGPTARLTVEGELMGKATGGTITLVQEDGGWKVAEMSWNAGGAAAPPVSAAPDPAAGPTPADETDPEVHFFCRTSNFRGTITLNGTDECSFGEQAKDYQFGCPSFADKVRYGENKVDVSFASLGEKSLPHRLEIRVARYDRAKGKTVDLKSWTFDSQQGGVAGLLFVHRRP